METIRARRRARAINRKVYAAHLEQLDAIALEAIKSSYTACASSWGGTRCPGCGAPVRPHWITPFTVVLTGSEGSARGLIHGQNLGCTGPGKHLVRCRGEHDWQA